MTYMLVVILHDLSRLPDILAAWRRIGVPGATLIHSIGGLQAETWLGKIGLGGLSRLFEHDEDIHQRMIISVINDEQLLERAISEADEIVGGFDRPHSGILFAVPVSHTLGVNKRRRPDAPTARSEEKLRALDRSTPVEKIVKILELPAITVQADAQLIEIVEQMLAYPRVHLVCVVNREQRLMGLIDAAALADALFFSVFPEEFLGEIKDIEQVMAYAQRTQTRLAEDLMRQPIWVKMDDNLEKAFHLMHEHKLPGLPVIDDHYHIVGYINLLELMSVCLRQNNLDAPGAAV